MKAPPRLPVCPHGLPRLGVRPQSSCSPQGLAPRLPKGLGLVPRVAQVRRLGPGFPRGLGLDPRTAQEEWGGPAKKNKK